MARRRSKRQPAAHPSHPSLLDPVVVALVRRAANGLCRRRVFPWADRSDLEQDLFAHLLRARPRFRPARGSWRAFAAAVVARRAATLARDRRTRHRRLPTVGLTTDLDRDGRQRTTPADPADIVPLAVSVAAVLADAPPTLKTLAERLAHEPLSVAARALGIGRGAARGRLARLRRRFEDANLLEPL
jgi:DNA-directed RNA polymerase specialized sigma24 family protein